MNDLGIRTKHPIVVTNWTNEEGARFAPAMLASGVFAGVHTLDYAYDRKDPDGKTFGDELKRIGWVGDEEVGARKMHAYFELSHRAGPDPRGRGQGDRRRHPLPGPVVAGVHADRPRGAYRLDADEPCASMPGSAMARIIEMVQAVAMENQPGAVGGVGQVFFSPNSRNVLPGKVVFTVDIRSPDQAKLDGMRATIEAEAAKICEALGVGCAVEAVGHFDPGHLRPDAASSAVRKAAEELGYTPHEHHLRRRPRRLLDRQGRARRR